MSPLARSLLALACAALLHASSADFADRARAEMPDNDPGLPLAELKQGILDKEDKNLRKIQLQPTIVPVTNSTTDFIFNVPNKALKNEALVGQDLAAFDLTSQATKLTLTPVTPGHHSPLKAHCVPSCSKGILIIADQFAIKILG